MREGTNFFSFRVIGHKKRRRKKTKPGTFQQIDKVGQFTIGDEDWFETKCLLEENAEGRKTS